jgi:hypothetical protein
MIKLAGLCAHMIGMAFSVEAQTFSKQAIDIPSRSRQFIFHSCRTWFQGAMPASTGMH